MWRSVVVGGLVLGLPASAWANEFGVSFGAVVTSEYVSDGLRYSDGPALQPYVEFGYGSLYFGGYVSNVDPNYTGADFEYGVTVGYRGEAGVLSYDIGVAYYMYDEAFPDFPVEDVAETYLIGTVAVTDLFYLTGDLSVTPEYDQTNVALRGDYYTAVEGLSFGALIGRLDANYGDWTYWSADVTYAATENLSLNLSYHDTDIDPALGLVDTNGLVVASLTLAF